MIHIFTVIIETNLLNRNVNVKVKHEYWEEEKFNLPKSDKDRKPYYVCYTY